jgi:hypothetical protein
MRLERDLFGFGQHVRSDSKKTARLTPPAPTRYQNALSPRRALAAVPVLLVGLGSAAPTSADAPRSPWARGLVLYKQTRYAEACPLLAQAAAQSPTNGAIWGDLGLCEFKRGDTAASIHASLLAVRHGDERVRKSAYFNLHLAGYSVAVPSDCAALNALPAELECTTPAFACTKGWEANGTGEGDNGTVAVFASSADDAAVLRDAFDGPMGGAQPAAVPLHEFHSCFFSWCSLNGWRCDFSPLVDQRATTCASKAVGPLPKDLCVHASPACDAYQRCSQQACDAATAAIDRTPGAKPWPAVVREHDQRMSECMKDCVEGDTLSCEVVVVDPCRDRIGYVCTEPDPKTKKDHVQAGEVSFER